MAKATRRTVMVALLRAVNVGGHSKLTMSVLRDLVMACGGDEPRTYIQSGNVVFATTSTPTAFAAALERAIAEATTITTDVITRTKSEMESIVSGNPFVEGGADPGHLHVVFLKGAGAAEIGLTDLDRYAPEAVVARGRELYLMLPGGVGRSKLAGDLGRRHRLGASVRNWRTVGSLLTLCDEVG